MAIPVDDVILLAKHLISELAQAQGDLVTSQDALAKASAAFSDATTRFQALTNVRNSLLQIPAVADVLKTLDIK